MAYVPGFRYDLFVSYGSEDNVEGWVEKFQERLTSELKLLLGRPFSDKTVYFDKLRLRVGQAYPDQLDNAARDSAMLVALLSPSYATSDWCTRERTMFQERMPAGASFAECLAAVRLRTIAQLPQVLADAQHEDFLIPGFAEPWPANSAKWTETVNRLAVEIRDALQKLRSRAGAVFVGAAPLIHSSVRENLIDFLAEQHFRAVPDPALLDDRIKCQEALTSSACAVHFVGGARDAALETLEDSTAHCPGPTIVFQPFGTTLSAAEAFVLDGLSTDRYPHRLSDNETELRKFLADLLTQTRRAQAGTSPSLGLVCEPPDFAWAQTVAARDLTVDYPRFLQEKLTNTERVRRLRQLVRESHGLLFYHGRSSDTQLERIERLAQEEKSRAVRRWYLDAPDLDEKRKKRPADPAWPDQFESFLDEVRRRAAEGES